MKVRFLAGADLNKAIVSGVLRREPSVDFQTAQAAALRGKKDAAGSGFGGASSTGAGVSRRGHANQPDEQEFLDCNPNLDALRYQKYTTAMIPGLSEGAKVPGHLEWLPL